MCRGYVMGVLEIEEYLFEDLFESGLIQNDACVHHTAAYPVRVYCCLSGTTCVLVVVQYTAVYPVQRVYLS